MRLAAFFILLFCGIAHAQPATTTVPGTLLNNPLKLPNPVLFSGAPGTLTANGQSTLGASTTLGAIVQGEGSSNDVTIENKSGTSLCNILTGTTTLNCTAYSVGGTALAFPASGLLVGTTDTQILTNKTLASPAITGTSLTLASTDALFGSGRPWCDVRAQGALGNGSTDDTAAINACIAQLHSKGGGGTLIFPPGNGGNPYCTFSGFTTNSSDIALILGASNGVDISTCNHNVTPVTLTSGSSGVTTGIYHLLIFGYGGPTDSVSAGSIPSHPALLVTNCYGCRVIDVTTYYGTGVQSNNSPDSIFERDFFTLSYGHVFYEVASPSAGSWFHRVQLDTTSGDLSSNYGTLGGTTFSAWSSGFAYTAHKVVSSSGFYYQTPSGCTSGSTAPSLHPYNVSFSDGGCTWFLLAMVGEVGALFDTGSNQNFLDYMDIEGPYSNAVAFANTNSGLAPTLTTFANSNFGATLSHVINANIGNGLIITNSTFGACYGTNCVAVYFNGSFLGDATIANNWIHDVPYGVDLFSLTNSNIVVIGNRFTNISGVALTTANASKFSFSDNICGNSNVYSGAVAQCYNTNATGSNYVIVGNSGTTTTTGATSNSSPANGAAPSGSVAANNI